EVAAQQHDSVDDSMQVNNDLTAHPIDIVATLAAQRPRHRRQGVRVRLFAVVLVRADIPVLAEGTPHVAGGEKDRARALRAAIEQLFAGVMEMGADPRTRGELASAELGTSHAVDLAISTDKNCSARACGRQVRGTAPTGSDRPPLAAMTRPPGSPASARQISA